MGSRSLTGRVLVIAGSDPSGGAGLQGDLATLAALQCYAMAVPTALTVQSDRVVSAVHALPATMTERSIRVLLDSTRVDAIKIGMLHDGATARAVARALQGFGGPIVVDPVLRPTRGRNLSQSDLRRVLLEHILPLARLLTPNLDEAAALCGRHVDDVEAMLVCGQALQGLGAQAVLVKGGHLRQGPVDALVDEDGLVLLRGTRLISQRTHGTGCALSTSTAALLARGLSLRTACLQARQRLQRALSEDHPVGRGTRAVAHAALGRQSSRRVSVFEVE